jgi:hypothetical protein
MGTTVLDSVDGIELDFEAFPIKNLQALYHLPEGLHLLASSVRASEVETLARFGPHLQIWMPPAEQIAILTNWFSWFSVSLVSYLRLIKLLALMSERRWDTPDLKVSANREEIMAACTAYVKNCVPAIYHWRNKIGAHTAITDPFASDSLGTLEASLITPVSYKSPHFLAGGYNWGTRGEESAFVAWSATEVFEQLASRLWPTRRLPALGGPRK